MRHPACLVLLITLTLSACVAPDRQATGPAATPPRAVWVWEPETFRLLDDAAYRSATIAFLHERAITTVYLYADAYAGRTAIRDEPQKYRDLIRTLHGEGIAVEALLGSWYLHTSEYVLPEKRAAATAMLQRVLDYNARADKEERLAGVSFDIEPHQLDDWESQRALRTRQLLDLMRHFVALRDAAQPGLRLGAAIPFWFDALTLDWQGEEAPAAEHLQRLLDYVALMDYRDAAEGSDGIIRHAERELQFADRIGKKVVVGVETRQTAPPKVTFFEEGNAVLEHELSVAAATFGNHPSFAGFAIHHLQSYRELTP